MNGHVNSMNSRKKLESAGGPEASSVLLVLDRFS